MHTFKGKSCSIFHNSDLSGNVKIVTGVYGENSLEVLGEDLLDFVANFVRDKRISDLEQASTDDILGI